MTQHKICMQHLIPPVLTDKREGSLVGSKSGCSTKVLPGGAKSFNSIRLVGLSLLINAGRIICIGVGKNSREGQHLLSLSCVNNDLCRPSWITFVILVIAQFFIRMLKVWAALHTLNNNVVQQRRAGFTGDREAGSFSLDFLKIIQKSLSCFNTAPIHLSLCDEAYSGHSAGCPLIYIY